MHKQTTPPDLRGKTVLLTGATGGLGGVLAHRLAERGATIVLTGRNADKLSQMAKTLSAKAIRALIAPADLSSTAAVEGMLAAIDDEVGPLDILVSNAGVEYYGAYTRHDIHELEQTITTNLLAPMILARLVLPDMIARRTGHIVFMSSISGKAPNPYGAAYSASKAGLVGLSNSLRTELTGTGVSCSVICPAFITDVQDGMFIRIQREGLHPPGFVGVAPAAHCADAVMRVLRTGEPEIIVSNKPLRLMLAAEMLWPALSERVLAKTGVTEFFRQLSVHRGRG